MTLRNYIIIAALGSVLAVRAQEEPAAPVFRPPFDFPLILSGNFGELRSNHFHGGVDFKTQGEVGKPIHCISNVFISHTNTLLSLVTSRRINLPFERRHLFTLSKNACGSG